MIDKTEAYCLKCKGKKEIVEPQPSEFKNGTPILVGTCSGCGGKLFRIVKKPK